MTLNFIALVSAQELHLSFGFHTVDLGLAIRKTEHP
jgi:hypothetical protein